MIAKKVDENQTEIVKAFRALGCSVSITSAVGQGYPDINVGTKGLTVIGEVDEETIDFLKSKGLNLVEDVNLLVEIKDGDKTPSQQKLTPAQIIFHTNWKGQICVVKNEDEVRALIKGE